jgi:hypothetical protein
MDPATLILPGAQSLVSQILSDGWVQVRAWLSRRLSHSGEAGQAEVERQLDAANDAANALPFPVSAVSAQAARRLALEAYWAGYLAALADGHPGFPAMLAELVERQGATAQAPATANTVSGTVTGHVVQAGHIEGGVRFG